jgi:hypothetical protein
MNMNKLFLLPITVGVLNLFAQNPVDPYMGDWSGSVTLGGQPQPVAVYMIPLSNGKYEARFVADFAQRGPYLHQLKGEIRNGQFRFMDNIPFDVNRVVGANDKGVVLDAALWAGPVSGGAVKGTIAGKLSGSFELKQTQRVSPNLGKQPPPGAIVLFDGTNLDAWRHRDQGKPVKWKLNAADKTMEVSGGDIVTREKFGDRRLHLEFRLPYMPTAFGQGRANSGVYPQGRYEVQVLDSYGFEGADNECGGIYTVSRPKVNMCAPPLQWQSYDIEFKAAKFDASGKKTAPAHIIVNHNGTVVQDTDLLRTTGGALSDRENEPDGLLLQDHTNPVQYRNIWAEKL